MEEDEMYAFVGLRAKDERAEQARLEAEKQKDSAPGPSPGHAQGDLNPNETEIDVNDVVTGEADIFYDRDDPPMEVGTQYVTLNRFLHSCASLGRVKTKMASYKWVAEKAIPFLKKNPNMGTKKLKEELKTKYNVTIGYHTLWQDKSQWPKVNLGFKLLPPLTKRGIGRQRKNIIVGCFEKGGGKPRTKRRVVPNKEDH
ncbi:hypothetical protein E2562_028359 [Oryza meyeriana var. granulata]|uniref:Transposase MuDR plant domain-containing protein n=1 Tax=Oryza meyeriana var. granulata TaxID=110450 RepID=A0A6G1D9B3_9ORYZ|nr:hypothetical protein E2562_028359 [Oryza meyeriana var. granulata]